MKLTEPQLRSVGLSKQKSSYLRDMAERAARGDLDFSKLHELPDEEVIQHLTQVKGVGEWTAQMFLMFTLQAPQRLANRRFRRTNGHQEALQQAQTAQAFADGKNRQSLGTVSQCGLLVLVEKPGSQREVDTDSRADASL